MNNHWREVIERAADTLQDLGAPLNSEELRALSAPASPQGVSEVVESVLVKWEQLAADCVAEAQRQSDPRLAREIARDAGQYRACIGGMRDALKRYTAAGAAPEGWVLVPREPTHEMLAHAWGSRLETKRKHYAAMLAAAPNPGAQHGQEGR